MFTRSITSILKIFLSAFAGFTFSAIFFVSPTKIADTSVVPAHIIHTHNIAVDIRK